MKQCAAVRAVASGFGGVLESLVALGLSFAFVALVASALTSVANGGTTGLGSFAAPSASPSPNSAIRIDGTPAEQSRIATALDSLVWPVDTPTLRIVVTAPQNLPTDSGAAYVYPENIIYVSEDYVDDPKPTGQLPHLLAHEIGHMVDFAYLDAAGRTRFLALCGYPPNTDWLSPEAPWQSRPSEVFAEAFAALDAPASNAPTALQSQISESEQIRSFVREYAPGAGRLPTPSWRLWGVARLVRDATLRLVAESSTQTRLLALAFALAILGAGERRQLHMKAASRRGSR